MDCLWNSFNIFWTNKNNHWMTHRRTKIHSLNLKILNQDDVISSKPRTTFRPSSQYFSCFLPCPTVHTWRLQESVTPETSYSIIRRGMQSGLSDPAVAVWKSFFLSGWTPVRSGWQANLAIGQRGGWSNGFCASTCPGNDSFYLAFRHTY